MVKSQLDGKPRPRLSPVEDRALAERIMDAISKYEDALPGTPSWSDLDALSTQTTIDSIEADPEGLFLTTNGHSFEATASVHVTLNYGGKDDHTSTPDTYPAFVTGSISDNGTVAIETFVVDTSSFYK